MSFHIKYRPQTLDQVKGNDKVIQTLKGMLEKKEKPHTYLLYGPTGCGKTTIARIIANNLECKENDFREINTADLRGIDTSRDIISKSQFAPMSGTVTVWLIDECFSKNTKIDLFNGNHKFIQDIKKGDVISNLKGRGVVKNTFVNKISLDRIICLSFSNNENIICSEDHLFLTQKGWVKAKDLKNNLVYLKVNSNFMSEIRVENITFYKQGDFEGYFKGIIEDKERNQGFVEFYDLEIDSHPSYFANDVLVHNCHKLTNDAQNALLKILEDTPSHVYFILCTTDPQKLLPTIKGRCSQFQLTPPSPNQIYSLLRRITREEGQELEKQIYDQIIESSQCLPRTALQILEQVLNVPVNERLAIAKRNVDAQAEIMELCRALVKGASWSQVKVIIEGLKDQEPETIRRVVLGYCQAVLLKSENDRAALIIEEFWEPTYDVGFPYITYACYSIIKH